MSMLKGQRILVIEDEPSLALALEDILVDAGAEVVGPANNVSRALELAATPGLTAAIVDLRLRNESAHPVVDRLVQRGVPFVFLSGSDNEAAKAWPNAPRLVKPARPQAIIEALAALGK